MPARNAETTIVPAIRSALRAFPKDSQIAVWDDASEDNTKEVAQAIDNHRVTVLTSPTSIGSGAARQRLLEVTDSEFIAIQDADDISLPWRQKLQSTQGSTADFSFAAAQRFSERKCLHRPSSPFNYEISDIPVALIFHNPLAHSTMIARRTALMDIGGYSNSRVAQDYEMLLRAAAAGKRIKRIGVPAVLYRISPTQVSGQNDYGVRILASEIIRASYSQNVQALLSDIDLDISAAPSIKELQSQITLDRVINLIEKMSIHLRPYYRHLCRHQRFGHLASSILT